MDMQLRWDKQEIVAEFWCKNFLENVNLEDRDRLINTMKNCDAIS
jgi:hypothetical protein